MTVAAKLGVFESALADGYQWVEEVKEELGWEDAHYALRALRAALHALRDRLSVEQDAHLAAQLPLLIRGLFYENWVPAHTSARERHLPEFLTHIAEDFRQYAGDVDPEDVSRSVFKVLARHVSPGAVQHIVAALPREIRDLWIP
jgi:uncharacterized protein (DUF2267 family)